MKKWSILNGLSQGDKIELMDGRVAEFVRLKRTKFIGNMDGESYDIPVEFFKEVVEKVDKKAIAEEKEKEYLSLKVGEPFFVKRYPNALLFLFHSIENGKIIGKNPATNVLTRIDASLYGGKVSNIEGINL